PRRDSAAAVVGARVQVSRSGSSRTLPRGDEPVARAALRAGVPAVGRPVTAPGGRAAGRPTDGGADQGLRAADPPRPGPGDPAEDGVPVGYPRRRAIPLAAARGRRPLPSRGGAGARHCRTARLAAHRPLIRYTSPSTPPW